MTYTIYMIRDADGVCAYVGCTAVSMKSRLSGHRWYGPLFKRYGKGIPGCTIEAIRQVKSVVAADWYEQYCIEKFRPICNYRSRFDLSGRYINVGREIGDPRHPVAGVSSIMPTLQAYWKETHGYNPFVSL